MKRSFNHRPEKQIFSVVLQLWCVMLGCVTPALCDPTQPSKRIKNGSASYAYSNTGVLETDDYSCTATLIPGSSCILTASHCTTGNQKHSFSLGDAHYQVESFSSPKTGRNTRADIAIGKLSKAPVFEIEFAYDQLDGNFSLAAPDHEIAAGTPLTVVGFGETGSQDKGKFGEKQAGNMTFSHYSKRSAAGRRYRSTTLALHPGTSGVSVCSGDSGGPVFEGDTLVGITSAGWQIEQPSFLCAADSPATTQSSARKAALQSCSGKNKKGKSGSVCLDDTTNLQWSTIRPARQRLYLEHLMNAEHIPADLESSHGVAASFCEKLNAPEEHLESLRSAGIRVSKRYRQGFLSLAKSGSNWRLPTTSELISLADGQSRHGRKANSLALKTISAHGTHLFWADDSSNDQPYRPVVHIGTGLLQYIGANATSCDRQTLGEAVSVAHYSEWISSKMQALGCM